MEKHPISIPSGINVMPLKISQLLIHVSGCMEDVQSMISGPVRLLRGMPHGDKVPAEKRDRLILPKSLPAALLHISNAGPGL